MSNAKELLKKLELHRDTDLLDIDTDIDVLVDLAEKVDNEFEEFVGKEEDLNDKIDEFDSEIQENRDITLHTASEWGLLGVLITEEINSIMKNPKTNQNKFLEMLQSYNRRRN